MMKNWKKRLTGSNSAHRGVILILAVVFMLLGALIIIPLLSFTSSGINSSKTYNEKAENLYSADAGIEDALWQIKYEHMNSLLVNPSEYNAFDYDTTWQYQLPDQPNGDTVTVTVDNVWIPKDITPPGAGEATSIISSGRLMVTGGVAGGTTGRYNLAITYYAEPEDFIDPTHLKLNIDTIGVWLPPGFTYSGDCSLEVAGQPYYATPVTSNHQGGQAVIWSFSSLPFNSFPGVSLIDSPMTFDVSFDFTAQNPGTRPDAVGWINTSGVSGLSYAWDIDIKVFKIASTASGTAVETYVAKRELRSMDGTVNGDYYAFGNSLLTDDNYDKARENLHASSYSDVTGTNIPDDAEVSAAYLYWSGWKSASDVFSDTCSSTNFTSYWTNSGDWAYNNYAYRGNHTGLDSRRDLTVNVSSPIDLSTYKSGMASLAFDYYLTPTTAIFSDDCSSMTSWTRSGGSPYTDTAWKAENGQFKVHLSSGADEYRYLTLTSAEDLSTYASGNVALSWDRAVAPPGLFFTDSCSDITTYWTRSGSFPYTDTSWKQDTTYNRYSGHSSGGDDSKNYLTMTGTLDLSGFDPGTAAVSWAQGISIEPVNFLDDTCDSAADLTTNWTQTASDWTYYSGTYRGRHTGSTAAARELTLKAPVNMTSVGTNGTITVTWSQSSSNYFENTDGLNYAYSLDNGSTWVGGEAFRGRVAFGTDGFSVDHITLPSQFLLKFIIVDCTGNNENIVLDNISINAASDITNNDGLNFSVSGDGGATWSGDYIAFRGENPDDANFAVPVEYQTNNFKIRFHLIGFTGTSLHCTIDDIQIACSYSHNDGLDYAFSSDGGATWSEKFEDFRGNIGTTLTTTAVTIPDEYMTANFKVRFYLASNTDPGETVLVDNIKLMPSYSSSDGLDVAFSNDGGGSWSENIPVFRGDVTSATGFKYAVPSQYLSANFKMKFTLVGLISPGFYCNIDNIAILVPDNAITFIMGDTGTGASPKQASFESGDDDGDGIFYEPRLGSYSLLAQEGQVVRNYSGTSPHGYSYSAMADVTELIREYTSKAPDPAINYPGHARYTIGAVDADINDEWSYAGWSLIIIYVSGQTQGHQLYLYDNFVYSNHDTTNGVDVDFDGDGSPGGNIDGFVVPQQIEGETYAAKITCFVGEGDDWYYPDYIALNAPETYWGANCKNMPNENKLWDGTTSTYNASSNTSGTPNNVWNGKSLGMSAQGVDVDTFNITWDSGLVNAGDTSAHLDIFTKQDVWNVVYIIISFRDKTSTGGAMSYLIHN